MTNKDIVKQLDALRTKIKVNKTSIDVKLYQTTLCSVKLQLEENSEQLQRKIKEYEHMNLISGYHNYRDGELNEHNGVGVAVGA